MQMKDKTVNARKYTIQGHQINNDLKNAYVEINKFKMSFKPQTIDFCRNKIIYWEIKKATKIDCKNTHTHTPHTHTTHTNTPHTHKHTTHTHTPHTHKHITHTHTNTPHHTHTQTHHTHTHPNIYIPEWHYSPNRAHSSRQTLMLSMGYEPPSQQSSGCRPTPYTTWPQQSKMARICPKLLSQSFEQQQQQQQLTDNTEIRNSSIQTEGEVEPLALEVEPPTLEVEPPAPEEVRIVTECLKDNKHQVGIRYQQKYIKLEVQPWNSESVAS